MKELKFWFAYIYNQFQTTLHKFWVAYYIFKLCFIMVFRAIKHDFSKYGNAESIIFAKNIFELKKCEYNSPEYKAMLVKINPCLQHHYSHNSHHPEYYKTSGFQEMSAADRIEMIADWCAAVRRNKNGCIWKSIEGNQARFKYSDADKEWLMLLAKEIC